MYSFLRFLKNNKEFVLLIPTVLGALYQIVNITYFVGIPYIRYFSVLQIIPDSILVILYLLFLSVIGIIILIFLDITNEYKLNSWDINFSKFSSISLIVLSSLMVISLLYNLNLSQNVPSTIFITFKIILIKIAIGVFLLITFSMFNNLCILKYGEKTLKILFLNLKARHIISLIAIIVFLKLGIELMHTTAKVNQSIVNTENLYNYKELRNKIMVDKNIKNLEILYTNRDYIFYAVETDHNRQVSIVKMDELISMKKD